MAQTPVSVIEYKLPNNKIAVATITEVVSTKSNASAPEKKTEINNSIIDNEEPNMSKMNKSSLRKTSDKKTADFDVLIKLDYNGILMLTLTHKTEWENIKDKLDQLEDDAELTILTGLENPLTIQAFKKAVKIYTKQEIIDSIKLVLGNYSYIGKNIIDALNEDYEIEVDADQIEQEVAELTMEVEAKTKEYQIKDGAEEITDSKYALIMREAMESYKEKTREKTRTIQKK